MILKQKKPEYVKVFDGLEVMRTILDYRGGFGEINYFGVKYNKAQGGFRRGGTKVFSHLVGLDNGTLGVVYKPASKKVTKGNTVTYPLKEVRKDVQEISLNRATPHNP